MAPTCGPICALHGVLCGPYMGPIWALHGGVPYVPYMGLWLRHGAKWAPHGVLYGPYMGSSIYLSVSVSQPRTKTNKSTNLGGDFS